MEQITIIANDAPYGTEKVWNALRLASALLTRKTQVNIFLLGDSVSAGKRGQETPKGYYNLAKMVEDLLSRGAVVKACSVAWANSLIGQARPRFSRDRRA